MTDLLRTVLALVGGTLAASLVVAVAEYLAHAALQGEAMFAAVVLGYGFAALTGAAVAAGISRRNQAVGVVLVLAALAVINLFAFPHPVWFAPAATVALAAGLGGGLRLASHVRRA